jgi:hypothetical protein
MIAVAVAVALVVVLGPLLLGFIGFIRSRRTQQTVAAPPWNWRLTSIAALLYTLAFNLTFFIQELFLVVPKAFTPGLRPTLFHNNHRWDGDHPFASLFQGTGALAIFISAVVCVLLLRSKRVRSWSGRLLLIWMAYNGFFQSLPQVVVGALNPLNDVGMAMEYLQLNTPTKLTMALAALAAIPPIALWLTRQMLGLAQDDASIAGARARTRFIFQVATLPALASIPLIIAFRVPREWLEVVAPPVVVTFIGIAWMQAAAWRAAEAKLDVNGSVPSLAYPLVAVVLLLLVFQLVLRRGVAFF